MPWRGPAEEGEFPTLGYAVGEWMESHLVIPDGYRQWPLIAPAQEAAPLVVRLYDVAPGAVFLVTSRVVLRIRGEQVYEAGSLSTPDASLPASPDRTRRSSACALFIDRAEAAKPGFVVTEENAADIADICRRLEGLPLAIELAAARIRMLSFTVILDRLGRSLDLGSGARDVPERQRTIEIAHRDVRELLALTCVEQTWHGRLRR